jgi:ketosteroid isomerase-like protein
MDGVVQSPRHRWADRTDRTRLRNEVAARRHRVRFRGEADFPHAYFEAVDDAFEQLQSFPDEFIDAGDAVLVVTHLNWRGKVSGAHGETPIVAAFWVRAGKVFREETFTDRAAALEAVGLSE